MPDDKPQSPPSPRVLAGRRSEPEVSPTLVNLREPLGILRRHLRLILLVAAGVTAVVTVWAYTATPSYQAVAVIRLSDPRRALTGGVAYGPDGSGAMRTADPLLSQVELLRSRGVVGTVIDSMPILRISTKGFPEALLTDLGLTRDAQLDSLDLVFDANTFTLRAGGAALTSAYRNRVEFSGIQFRVASRPSTAHGKILVASRDAAISGVIHDLRVSPRARTDVIDVAFAAHVPERATRVVNEVVQTFRSASAEESRRQSRLRREFLQTQLRINDSTLAAARYALAAFRRRAGRFAPGEALARQNGAEELQLQREQLDADRRTYRLVLNSLDGSRDGLRAAVSTPGIGNSVVVSQLYTQLVQYERERDSLVSLSPRHPDLARREDLIASTETKLARAVQGVTQGLVASLDTRIAGIDQLRARRTTDAEQLSTTDAEEARLLERVENARQIADQLRSEFQRARIAEAVEVGEVEIVDLAVTPGAPMGLARTQKLGLGMLLGLLLGGGAAFLAEHLGSAVGRREDIEALGMALLSAVPRYKNGSTKGEAVVEAFRGLRLSVIHAYGTPGGGPMSIAITSPGSRDGKSFVACNLALAFAQANFKTLLIDGDCRRGTLHRVLSCLRRPGLMDLLGGEVTIGDGIQTTPFRGLYFIGCGVRRSDAPELLSSERIAELFAFLRGNFQVIIVDTPPLGAGVDAFALATAVGNLLLVLRPGMANRQVLTGKLDLLHRLPVRTLGAVLNDVQEGPEYQAYSYYLEGYEARGEPAERKRPVLRAAR